MSVHAGLVTVEEFLKLAPPKEGHIELHHGEVVEMPPPKKGHQKIQERLHTLMKPLFAGKYVVRVEMAFRPMVEHEVWQADVGCVTVDRDNATSDDEYLSGAPDLVVEVLSPSNTIDEITEKISVCMENGCVSFWVVDAKRRRVSVTEGNTTRHFADGEMLSCSILDGELPMRDIFA